MSFENTGDLHDVAGQDEVELGKRANVAVLGAPDHEAFAVARLEVGAHRLSVCVDLLQPEAQAEVGVVHLDIGRRHHRPVAPSTRLDKLAGYCGICLADSLAVAGAADVLGPRIRSPWVVGTRSHQHIPARLPVRECHCANGAILPETFLDQWRTTRGVFVRRIKGRPRLAMPCVALGEQRGRGFDQIGRETSDFKACTHGPTLRSRKVARVRCEPSKRSGATP